MRYTYYDGDTFERGGRTFKVEHPRDDYQAAPWDEYDCHGIVSDWTTRDKAPGERILVEDRSSKRFYDFAGTMQRAKRDGWGLGPDELAKLESKLGRAPTKGEIVAQAVENDFERLRGWCNDDWTYVGVVVTEIESDESDSLWRIESDAYDYLAEVAHELADEILARLNQRTAEEIEETAETVCN